MLIDECVDFGFFVVDLLCGEMVVFIVLYVLIEGFYFVFDVLLICINVDVD